MSPEMSDRLDEILHEVKESRREFHEHDKNDEGRHSQVMGLLDAHSHRLERLEERNDETGRFQIASLQERTTWASRNWLPTACVVLTTALALWTTLHK